MLKLARLPSGGPEIFASIQGEGVSAGMPSVFIRLASCNLRCTWCDTKYTWDWSRYDPKVEILPTAIDDIVDLVEHAGPRNVVITGGEPLLQQEELSPLAALLTQHGLRIEIETNGTIMPTPEFAANVSQWNVSPKLDNSGNGLSEREVEPVLTWFAEQPAAWFKFVVQSPEDFSEIAGIRDRYCIPRGQLLLMPEGTTPAEVTERAKWIVAECLREGYRFTTRHHILLWGDERGR